MFQYCKQMPNLNLLGMIEKVLNFVFFEYFVAIAKKIKKHIHNTTMDLIEFLLGHGGALSSLDLNLGNGVEGKENIIELQLYSKYCLRY